MNILSLGMRLLGKIKYAPQFEKNTKDPTSTQEAMLFDFIKKNKNTAYGKEHCFSEIKTISDYRKYVPLNKYSDLLPYIERIKKGEKNILTKEPTLLFALTSGATGDPKYIPITKSFIDKYKKCSQDWFYFLLNDHKEYFNNKLFIPPNTLKESKTKGGIKVGTIAGYLLKNLPSLIKKKYILSEYDLIGCNDYEAKYYLMMRLGIEHQVSAIAMANPATLILLCQKGNEYREEIINDIKKGTLSNKFDIDEKVRKNIEEKYKPNLKRATELESIIKEKGELFPKYYWKNLSSIGLWTGGPLSIYMPQLPKYVGNVPIRDSGYSATEGRFCTPIEDNAAEGVLTVDNIFYEFISEEEQGNKNPKILLANELEEGKKYFVIISSLNGMYRYCINDVIKVTGWYNKTPKISFQNKGEGISSIIGEKVSEWQILKVLDYAKQKSKLPFNYALVKAEQKNSKDMPYYMLYASFERNMSKDEKNLFIELTDESLKNNNIEYKKRRESLRMNKPQMKEIDGYKYNNEYHKYKIKKGRNSAQIKNQCLITDYNKKEFDNIIKLLN